MSQWIDFRALRRDLEFGKVLLHYGIELNIRDRGQGRQHTGRCPLKTCKSGNSAKQIFSANLDRGIWQCFFCKEHGNALDFIALMEGLDRSKGNDVKKAAKIARERYIDKKAPLAVQGELLSKVEEPKEAVIKTLINEPLDFTLQSLDASHEWFEKNSIEKRTIKHFGLGFCARGWLKGRIAIPLQRKDGKLIGYAGRLLDENLATSENPLYLFPEGRIHKGIRHEFQRSEFLYNGNSITKAVQHLVVTTNIETVWLLWQQEGYDAVSLMGEKCHPMQEREIFSSVKPDGMVRVIAAEAESLGTLLCQIAKFRAVRWAVVD